ncbi:MAG TPA: pilin [Candidatus Saccharimonadales bacterium]|nr:pilin [Candidatus Saccharimonadales bacterium]
MMDMLHYFAAGCAVQGGDFLGFPKWYAYLPGQQTISGDPNIPPVCTPAITQLSDIWLIVAAIIEIMLRIGALAAIGLIVYGGFQYMTSQGDPGKTKQARGTIINALIGLVISVSAATIVTFVAGQFK